MRTLTAECKQTLLQIGEQCSIQNHEALFSFAVQGTEVRIDKVFLPHDVDTTLFDSVQCDKVYIQSWGTNVGKEVPMDAIQYAKYSEGLNTSFYGHCHCNNSPDGISNNSSLNNRWFSQEDMASILNRFQEDGALKTVHHVLVAGRRAIIVCMHRIDGFNFDDTNRFTPQAETMLDHWYDIWAQSNNTGDNVVMKKYLEGNGSTPTPVVSIQSIALE